MNLRLEDLGRVLIPALAGAVLVGYGLARADVAVAQEAAPAAKPAPPGPAKTRPQSNAQIDAGEPRATAPSSTAAPSSTTAPSSTAARAPGQKAPGAADRLDLSTATVTGDREQPKVMYVVPWKKSDIGDLSGKPMNSLLDEALAPVDRDEFKREVAYYAAVRADASQNGASKAAKQGER